MEIFDIINDADSLIQKIIIIVCLCWYFNLTTLETMLNAQQFIKRLVFHTPYLWHEAGDPQFLINLWNNEIIITSLTS